MFDYSYLRVSETFLGKEDEIKITEASFEHFKDTYFAERPASERLVTKNLI